LFNRSIAENLRVGKPDASEAQLRDAAARAQALNFIDANPDGLQARIGERGRLLSGGERQRLAIARAFLKDAPILILDEPTSALDAETESLLVQATQRLLRNRTTFIIAHRLSTIRHADQIVVLSEGQIIEMGTHDELLSADGLYCGFHRAQFGDYVPEKVC
jgi:ATP-binding cassette subfamily B protein